jgi:hypothetical protein
MSVRLIQFSTRSIRIYTYNLPDHVRLLSGVKDVPSGRSRHMAVPGYCYVRRGLRRWGYKSHSRACLPLWGCAHSDHGLYTTFNLI